MEKLLDKNMYIIDLSNIENVSEVIFRLSQFLENSDVQNKNVCLKLGKVNLNQAQVLGVKSLINGANSSLVNICTKSNETAMSAQSLDIEVSEITENEIINDSAVEKPAETSEKQEKPQENVSDELDVIFGSSLNKEFFGKEQNSNIYAPKEELSDIVVEEEEYTGEDIEIEEFPTKYIKQTVRSGQVINYEGNVVIIGDCHAGCEINASGDITVWGILSGIAHAGMAGNKKAKIRALKMSAIQLRIADCYSRIPDALNAVSAEKTNLFTPEEAKIVNGEIVIFKLND